MRFRALPIILFATSLLAATPRESLLVDTNWLKQHLNDPNLVLLQVGDKESFASGHIVGAHAVTLDDVSVSEHDAKGLMLEMPAADDLHKKLEALGISDDSRVIVYFGKDWVSPATRVLLTLQYAGLGAHASFLDGGLPAWKRSGGAVTTNATPAKTGALSPLKLQPLITDRETVRTHTAAKGFAVVDGRAAVFYDGTDVGHDHGKIGMVDQRRGHVAGALSIPFTSITDDQLMIKPNGELLEIFNKAGVKPGDTVIGYCHIGQQATAMLLAARLLGHPVLLYDGSYQDWSRHTELPVDDPTKAAGK